MSAITKQADSGFGSIELSLPRRESALCNTKSLALCAGQREGNGTQPDSDVPNPEVGGENANVARLSRAGPPSECFDGQRQYVADAAFGQDDARRVWIGLQLAPQAQYLNVDTAIEDIFMDPGRLQKVFAGKRSLRSVEKRNQQRILAFGQRDRDSVGISEAAVAPIELPAAKSAPASFRVALDGRLASLPPAQHRPDPRQKFSQTKRLGDVVVGAQFQPYNPVDLVATMTRGDDHGNIGA